jgi:hypothetical protein
MARTWPAKRLDDDGVLRLRLDLEGDAGTPCATRTGEKYTATGHLKAERAIVVVVETVAGRANRAGAKMAARELAEAYWPDHMVASYDGWSQVREAHGGTVFMFAYIRTNYPSAR